MNALWVLLAAFSLAVPLVVLCRMIAVHFQIVEFPRPERASTTPRPYLGGVAVAIAASTTAAAAWSWFGQWDATMSAVVAAVAVSAMVGLSDDLRSHTAAPKLVIESLVAGLVVALGGTIALTAIPAIDIVMSLLVIVFLTNSFNLLDNSDGALASIGGVTGLGIAGVAFVLGQLPQGFLAVAVSGACFAFLLFNWHPASIFLGDAGSLFIGCALVCSLALIKGTDTPRSIPVAFGLMMVPIVDTVLVFLTRRREGRPFMLGGIDHLHHRLGRTSLGVRGGAAVLASIAAMGAFTAIAVAADALSWFPSLVGLLLAAGALLATGLLLPSHARDGRPLAGFTERAPSSFE